jgi:hypothetical protein
MHGDTIRNAIESSEQSHDAHIASLGKKMKRPCAVLTAAPGKKGLLHSSSHDAALNEAPSDFDTILASSGNAGKLRCVPF